MVSRVYCVYDRVAVDPVMLFEARNDGTAVRSFFSFVEMAKGNEEDYRLIYLGTFDHEKCRLERVDVPEDIATAVPRRVE